ncbi:MAG: hypothetical protein KF791_13065 [Verrucomicrobiae bacterium]|nr:hypothetical protein [Verrucomicrobiae bacterium]
MHLNILFLDIDGVLNLEGSRHPDVFAPGCVRELRRILDHNPRNHVVFSTAWRIGFPFFVLGGLWQRHGLPSDRVLGRTPILRNADRGVEIEQWLEDASVRHPDHRIQRIAVLDDVAEPVLRHLPEDAVFPCDPRRGLTAGIAEAIIRRFGDAPAPPARVTSRRGNPPRRAAVLTAPWMALA